MITVHGIRNCETVKKALAWLDGHAVGYTFRDYKKDGPAPAELKAWAGEVGWEQLLNRSGMTFRKLEAKDTANLDERKAIELMAAHPSAIRRPIVTGLAGLVIGFKPEAYAAAFKKK